MGRGLGPLLAGTGQRAGQGTGPGGRGRVGVWCTPAASRGRGGVLAGGSWGWQWVGAAVVAGVGEEVEAVVAGE